MCPTYDETNVHWSRVDNLYSQQQRLLTALTNLRPQLQNEKVDKESNQLGNEMIDIGNDTEQAVNCISAIQDSAIQEDLETQFTSTPPHVFPKSQLLLQPLSLLH